MSSSYYVYALKDPRKNPAQIFYIGKGTGNRAWDHVINIDETLKGRFIKEIIKSGKDVIISKLVEDLTEYQSLKIESELISSFGILENGGTLYNSVVPSGTLTRKVQKNINVPTGAIEKSQIGIKLLKDALEEFSKSNAHGITNSDAAHYLGLQSDNAGKQKDYLTYSILGLLLKERRIKSVKDGSSRKYKYVDKNT
ncbi:hypothetical protein [Sulfurimonas sp.]|uniref:LEM-3-like GIY-YIG domain-containing protein n=1 Tax=Sulfurimonas sp. TaxID=2022749 RepID=UPI0035687B0D